ncbi:MAG: hypothetical protein KDK65_06380, partial [Chlamydiia bacterium]|nr:hypothetical protein [Chlamydiia bacterium]
MTRIGAFYVVWVLALFPCEPVHAREVPQEELKLIGQKIFANECSSRVDHLTCWNEGEAFASLGVGHFIWYPKGGKHPFEETFPRFIAFLKERGVPFPHWLDSPCPWHSRQEFYRAIHSTKMAELATFLNESIPHQIAYMQH